MKLSDFDFELPSSLIAVQPACPRDASRMLTLNNNDITDEYVINLSNHIYENDVIIFNDTKVIPAQLYGSCNGNNISCTLIKQVRKNVWQAFIKPSKKVSIGFNIQWHTGCQEDSGWGANVLNKEPDGKIILEFQENDFWGSLRKYGHMPLPPYMKRKAEPSDINNYQTMFAHKEGAVAAPTAGLHFTPRLLESLRNTGATTTTLTLHVGAGTFLPIKSEDITQHVMHSEYVEISEDTAEKILQCRTSGGRVIAVGTTVLRALEAFSDAKGNIKACSGETDIFITPGYQFKQVDMLFTNFHLPRSTLFMLVCAFSGVERMKEAYQHAINQKYRFFSYGDACLLTRISS